MSKEEVLGLLAQACRSVMTNAEGHEKIAEALRILAAAIQPKEEERVDNEQKI
jgi:truncated hemoglobin YjbI